MRGLAGAAAVEGDLTPGARPEDDPKKAAGHGAAFRAGFGSFSARGRAVLAGLAPGLEPKMLSLFVLFVWAKQKDPMLCTKLGTKIIESIIENMPMQ